MSVRQRLQLMWVMGDQLSWLEHLPYKQGVIGSSPISPTISCAEIAQLVEQLTCNQQVTGSIPVFGTIFFLEGQRSGQTRQTVNLFLRVQWFKSISLHHFVWLDVMLMPRSQAVRHHTLTVTFASSSLAEATTINVPLAQPVEHLTFNQRVMRSNRIRDTICN